MTSSYHLIVPLPAGRTAAGRGRLSVLFVPRLQATGDLNVWVRDWQNWPRVINGTAPGAPGSPGTPRLRLDVSINASSGPNVDFDVTDTARWVSPAPSEAAWRALFGTQNGPGTKSTRVERFRPTLRVDDDLLAPMYDAGGLSAGMEQLFRDVTEQFTESRPTVEELIGLGAFDDVTNTTTLADYDRHLEPLGDGDVQGETTPVDADFHRVVGYAQSHPELLRALGLLIDLDIALPPTALNAATIDVSSNYEANFPRGKAVPLGVRVNNEFWPVASATSGPGPGAWSVMADTHRVGSVDFGAAARAVEDVLDISTTSDVAPFGGANATGLYLARDAEDLVTEVEGRWAAQADIERDIDDHLESGTPSVVAADTDALIAGRRYDVWDETTGRWYSLWERATTPDGLLEFPRDPALEIPARQDEGWMTYTAFTEMRGTFEEFPNSGDLDPDPNPNPDIGPGYKLTPAPARSDITRLRLSPIVFGWQGWSLAADPPQRAFSGDTGPKDRPPNEPPEDMSAKVAITYGVPDGRLPRLRYTRQYKFRARVVDLAGNSIPLAVDHDKGVIGGASETPLYRFGRLNPLGKPLPVRRVPRPVPGWGDTVTTMVVKSDIDTPDGVVAETTRLFFPAPTTQFQCEVHGFPQPDDALFTDKTNYDMFVARTATTIEKHTSVDPVTGELVADPLGSWRPPVDYLVEPAMTGLAFNGLPGQTKPIVVPIEVGWPESHAVSLEMRAGNGPVVQPSPTTTGPAVVFEVPKGFTRTVFVSSAVSSELLPHWKTLQDHDSATFNRLSGAARTGVAWSVSEPQEVTVVHAVRQPLSIPVPEVTGVDRLVGFTQARLFGRFRIDRKSTGRIEVFARWSDPIDTPGSPTGVEDRTTIRRLFAQHESYDETDSVAIDEAPFDLADHKRHEATLTLDAFSRYARYFTERVIVEFDTATSTVALLPAPNEGISKLNVEVTAGPVGATAGVDYDIDDDAATITRLDGSRLPVGADVTVDFVRRPINRRSDEAGGGPYPVTFPNTGRPDAVAVSEVLPAFSREPFAEGDSIGVFHQGQTVRVWLERPWFTTGTGELLGVLVGRGEGPLTEFARDPLSSTPVPGQATVDDFPAATSTETGVITAEDENGQVVVDVDVAGYPVRFDPASERWFADVVVGGFGFSLGYRPIVKLAVCRYQPVSVDGAFVGDHVVTEPVRLGATRLCQVTRNGTQLDVFVEGPELGNEMTAVVQQADTTIADPDLRWSDVGSPILLAKAEGFVGQEWTGQLPLPTGGALARVVIEDAEILDRGATTVRNVAYVEAIELPSEWTADPPTVPEAPNELVATPQHQAVDLEWAEPADGRSPILRYTIERRVGAGAWGDPIEIEAPLAAARLSGLANGSQYGFRVRAENAVGSGPWSEEVTATPAPTAPAQIGPVLVTGGHQAVLVRWDPPGDTGAPVTGYRVERRDGAAAWGNGVDLAATSTRHIARGLTNGASYSFRVRATNALGDGPWSETRIAIPDVMVPGRVRRVVTQSAGGLVLVRWRSAAERGSPLVGYAVERREGTSGSWGGTALVGVDETSLTVNDLAADSEWEFRVRARNAVGNGAWSAPVAVTVVATGAAPAQVADVTVESGDGTLTMTWDEPDDGGVPIVRYVVERRPGGGAWGSAVNIPGDQLVHRYAGLTNGTTYGVRVRAVNVLGAGDWSAEVLGSPAP